MKFLFWGDLHATTKFGLHGMAFLKQIGKTLDWIGEVALAENIQHMFFLGDVYEFRQAVDTPSLHTTVQGFRHILGTVPNSRIYLIPGNHDMYRKEGDWQSTESLRDLSVSNSRLILYPKPSVIQVPEMGSEVFKIHLLPYTEEGFTPEPCHFAVGHLPISGAFFQPGTQVVEEAGVSAGFEGITAIQNTGQEILYIGGHYHHPQILGRSLIVGACCYHKFTDSIVDTPRGCVILELNEIRNPIVSDFRWVENPHTQPIHTIRAETRQEAAIIVQELQQKTRIPVDKWHLAMHLPAEEAEHLDDQPLPAGLRPQVIPVEKPTVVIRSEISTTNDPYAAWASYVQRVPPDRDADQIKRMGESYLKRAAEQSTT